MPAPEEDGCRSQLRARQFLSLSHENNEVCCYSAALPRGTQSCHYVLMSVRVVLGGSFSVEVVQFLAGSLSRQMKMPVDTAW